MSGRQIWLWITAGFVLWSTALIVAYAGHAIGCEFEWSAAKTRAALAAVLLGHGGALALLLVRAPRGPTTTEVVTRWTLVAAFGAVVATLAPAFLLSTCV